MDPDSIQPILFMVVLVIFSGYFSATETAFSTFNRIRLKNLAEDGNKRAKLVLELSENYDRLLSTILVGNNIVNILLTAIATVFFTGIYGEGVGPTVSTVVSTIVVLLFGEISPKSLAKEHAEAFTMATAPILRCIIVILYPINWVFGLWKKLLKVLFKSSDDQGVTEEELLTIVDEAEQDGALGEDESDLIRRAISFNDREAVDIIIPRVDVTGVPVNASYEDMRAIFAQTRFSRLPVYDGTMDNIVGVVHLKDCTLGETMPTPTDILKPAVFVPPTMPLRVLLKMLQDEKCHIAIVADEYGGTLGIVTLEDILEEIVGEIWDESDEAIEEIQKLGDDTYRVLCSTAVEDFFAFFELEPDGETEATTVNGWLTETVGSIPEVGYGFTYQHLSVTVDKADDFMTHEIVVQVIPRPAQPEE